MLAEETSEKLCCPEVFECTGITVDKVCMASLARNNTGEGRPSMVETSDSTDYGVFNTTRM